MRRWGQSKEKSTIYKFISTTAKYNFNEKEKKKPNVAPGRTIKSNYSFRVSTVSIALMFDQQKK